GYQYTFAPGSRLWRKNRRPNADGSFGVDPNRNYPTFWGFDDRGSSSVAGSEVFRGPGPGSEPEVQAVMAFHAAHPPRISISYHSFGDLVLHPYGFVSRRFSPDHALLRAIGGTAFAPGIRDGVPGSTRTAYFGGPGWQLYVTNGEYTEWAHRTHGTLAFTVETTAGCCIGGGAYYGFEFPDDSAMVRQVVRDNLPFALNALRAGGDPLAGATAPRLEVAWPEAWVEVAGAAGGFVPAMFTVRPVEGSLSSSAFTLDSLDRGGLRRRARAWAPSFLVPPRGVRVEGLGWEAEALRFGGAEDGEPAWSGWSRTQDPMVGAYSWNTGQSDTLTSPPVDLTGRAGAVWLQFWTRHHGSLFLPEWTGRVQASGDGITWTDVWAVAGSAPVWYPVRLDLPQLVGAPAAQVRFIGAGFPWWVDAVGLMTDQTTLFTALAAANELGLSENPVRGGVVV
ncbi:MAG: M14 family zinc carboxypeptidase, partial [Gemmatimonadales bacterium]